MGILTFLKNFLHEPKEPQKEKRAIIFTQLPLWISEKERENILEEKAVKKQLEEKMKELQKTIEEKQLALQHVNISSLKVEQKIKEIVEENLSLYVTRLNQFLANLRRMEKEPEIPLSVFLSNIATHINNFENRSVKHYQKATVLVGKELGSINEEIKKWVKEINSTIKNNESLFSMQQRISKIKRSLQEHQKNRSIEEGIAETIKNLGEKNKYLDKELVQKENKLAEWKTSQEYQAFLKSSEEIKEKKEDLDRELQRIKQDLNIKFLLKIFHNDKKKNNVIKSYEDVLNALESDLSLSVLSIVEEASSLPDAPQELKKITRERFEKIRQLKNLKIMVHPRLGEHESAIRSINHKVISTNDEIKREHAKQEKISAKTKQSFENLRAQLAACNLSLEES